MATSVCNWDCIGKSANTQPGGYRPSTAAAILFLNSGQGPLGSMCVGVEPRKMAILSITIVTGIASEKKMALKHKVEFGLITIMHVEMGLYGRMCSS